jgi:hypothetical protein
MVTVWHVTGRPTCLADSLVWQTHLPNAKADDTCLLNQAHVQYQRGTGGSTVEKPAKTQTVIRLASHLVRVPNSRSWEHEFEFPAWWELAALTKVEYSWGQVFPQW